MRTADGREKDFAGLVIRFSCIASNATLHRADCSAAKPSRNGAFTIVEASAEEVADLEERGFHVKACKCCKGRP